MSATEKKLSLFVSLFIAVLFNSYRLLALREGSYMATFWRFNGYELLFQAIWNFLFCVLIVVLIMMIAGTTQKPYIKWLLLIVTNFLLFLIFQWFGVRIQQHIFLDNMPDKAFRATYFVRMLASQVLMLIWIQIMRLLRKNNQKQKENEQLQTAYLNVQLQLLKEELNPHFFFNALSSLSATINESPKNAQKYIAHLAKIFRYTLNRKEKNMVPLAEELGIFQSFAALQKMRLEDNICIRTDIPDHLLTYKLPYMSLQPLLENAVKHNSASREKPLQVSLTANEGSVIIKNNLQPVSFAEESTATGLANLNRRFVILLRKPIDIKKTDTDFTVTLPLQKDEN